jgi:hypothetical protein
MCERASMNCTYVMYICTYIVEDTADEKNCIINCKKCKYICVSMSFYK